jgi:hypothetical protein
VRPQLAGAVGPRRPAQNRIDGARQRSRSSWKSWRGAVVAAAELAGIPRCLFLVKLADYGIDTFRLSEEELRHALREVFSNT